MNQIMQDATSRNETNVFDWSLFTRGRDLQVLSILIPIVGLFFIVTSVIMFVKNGVLHNLSNIFQCNILFTDCVLLIADWSIIEVGPTGCAVFSLVLISFGSASIFSAVCIALERYKKMANLTGNVTRKLYTLWMFIIWCYSLLTVVFPLCRMLYRNIHAQILLDKMPSGSSSPQVVSAGEDLDNGSLCFFTSGLLYDSFYHCLHFVIGSVIIPLVVMIFCYIRTFQNVRKARISRWHNQAAAQCSKNTRVIRTTARKANVIQMPQGNQNNFMPNVNEHNMMSSREINILLTGIISVSLILMFWLPIAIYWVFISVRGFDENYINLIQYLILLAKFSLILNVTYYVSFNLKYRKFYVKTIIQPMHQWFSLKIGNCEAALQDNMTGRLESLPHNSITTNMFNTQASGSAVLEPITEHLHGNFKIFQLKSQKRKTSSGPSQKLSIHLKRCSIITPCE